MHFPTITFQSIFPLIQRYGYLVIFFGSFIEGINIMLIGGFVASLRILNPALVFILLFLGDIMSDVMWYHVGYYGGGKISEKFAKIFHSEKQLKKVKEYLEEKGGKIIIPIKFTSGFCWAMLITAGSVKMKFKKFIKYDIIGSAGWTAFTFSLGYFFGKSLDILGKYIQKTGFTAALAAIAAIVIVKAAQKIVGRAEKLE